MNTMTYAQKNNKRFSDEQIKSLEIKFRADSRLELKSKQQLAGELGLHPRQVAVWFQNRRARSRAKQIEREHNNLKATYDNLASKVESLKRENQELNKQLQNLKALLGKHPRDVELGSGQGDNGQGVKNPMTDVSEDLEKDLGMEAEVFDLAKSRDGSITSSMDWCSFDSSSYIDESSGSQWWETWLDD